MMFLLIIAIVAMIYYVFKKDIFVENITYCGECKTEIKDSYLYCPNCNKQLKKECENCKKYIDVTWRHCPYCD